MANLIAFIIGGISLLLALIGFIPFLGALNWIILPMAGVGAIFGIISSSNSGRNFCFVVMAICVFRLWLGWGIF